MYIIDLRVGKHGAQLNPGLKYTCAFLPVVLFMMRVHKYQSSEANSFHECSIFYSFSRKIIEVFKKTTRIARS